jgi:hypothetical protein
MPTDMPEDEFSSFVIRDSMLLGSGYPDSFIRDSIISSCFRSGMESVGTESGFFGFGTCFH